MPLKALPVQWPPRLHWIAQNVASAFDQEESFGAIEEAISETLNMKKIYEFLEGKSKHQHIFFFYQRPDAYNEANELIDGNREAKFKVTSGESERLKNRAVYFLRNVPPDRAIRLDVLSDAELLFGEVMPNPLESLSATLGEVFRPLVSQRWEGSAPMVAWGECDAEQQGDFLGSFEKFTTELSEAIRALGGGITLNKDLLQEVPMDADVDNPDVVHEYGQLLEAS